MSKYISYIILLILTSVVPVIGTDNKFIGKELNDENLVSCMKHYDIDNIKWVLSQAKLETGNYTSRLCRQGNNLFGLFNSRKGSYFKFNHWSLSVKAYKDFIQREGRYDREKYNEENYHKYLTKIGYAEAPDYVQKLRGIMKRGETNNDVKRNEYRGNTKESNNKNQRPKQQLNSGVSYKKRYGIHTSRKNKHSNNPKERKQFKKNDVRSVPKQHIRRTSKKNS